MDKHFKKWVNSPLFVFSLFSKAGIAKAVTHFLLSDPYNGREWFTSNKHKTIINVVRFYNCISTQCTQQNLQVVLNLPIVQENVTIIRLIKDGYNLWKAAKYKSPVIISYQTFFMLRLGRLPRNTQFTERGVKDSKYVTLGNRNELTRSIFALARSTMIDEVAHKVKNQKRERKRLERVSDEDDDITETKVPKKS